MKSESEFISEQLQAICDGEPWYGDSVFKILEGVTAAQAAARPLSKSHTIWEIVRHLIGWTIVDRRRLQGENERQPKEGDWPAPGTSVAEWQADLARFKQAMQDLSKAMHELPEPSYEKILARGSGTYRGQMHGALQHIVYHSAQIAILKKSL
jgi:hypothetical protein